MSYQPFFRTIYILLLLMISFAGTAQKVFKTRNVVDHWQNSIKSNDQWRYFPGTKEPDSNWIHLNYVDTSWGFGKGGIGFGDGDDSTSISSGISSLYIRKSFNIADTSKIWDLLLNADYDDGFVAYINGKEIARRNIGIPGIRPRFNELASGPHEANMYQGNQPDYIYVPKSTFASILQTGNNVLCIQIHNDQINSSDLTGLFWLHFGINDSTQKSPIPPAWFAPTLVTHLPIVIINTNGQGIPNEPKLTCKMGIIENGTDQNHYTDSLNHYNGWIGIETRGSSSSGFPQQSYGFSLYADSLGTTHNKKLLGFPKEHDFILYAPYTDKSLMRNNLVYQLSREMGWYASRTRYVELVLNGSYQGIYVLMENIKADQNRINIPTMNPSQRSGDTITGGYIMKVDRVKQSGLGSWYSNITLFNGQAKSYRIQTVDPDIPDLNQQQLNYIKPWMDQFESVLISNNFSNTSTGFKRTTDVNSFIDFYIANELTRNVDAYRLSNFFYKQRESLGGRLYMGPVWDFNIALGNANYCNGNDTVGWNDCGYANIPFWYERMLQDNDYKRQLVCRWQGYRKDVLKLQHIYDYIDSVAEYLEIPQRRHYQKWQILGQYVWPNYYIGQTYKDEVNFLKRWVRGRLNWMDKNMPKVPAICNSAAATGIYISEIMYNCQPNRNGGNWIELYNSYGIAYNVGNFVIRDESGFRSYTIPANTMIPSGGYLVIVEDSTAFKNIYPQVKNYVGPMNWGLPNDHGTISLRDASNYLVAKVNYSDTLPWPQLADGKGHSLELVKAGMAYNNPQSWRNGCIDGTPGSGSACWQPILISEINYASAKNYNSGDWAELYNRDTATIDLSGWILKDDNDSNIFKIPNGTRLKGGERCIISNDKNAFRNIYNKNITLLGDFKFGFGSGSDAVRLFDSSLRLISEVWYTDSFPFPYGAEGTGLTIELIDSATNPALPGEWRLSCFLGTPGKSRKYQCNISDNPKLTLTEAFILPDNQDNPGKWLELKSRDSLYIDLSNAKLVVNGQSLYTFPTGRLWNPMEYLVLAGDSISFVNKYKLSPTAAPLIQNLNWPLSVDLINSNNDTIYKSVFSGPFDACGWNGRTINLNDTIGKPSYSIGCYKGSPGTSISNCNEYHFISEIHSQDGGWLEILGIDSNMTDLSGFTLSRSPGNGNYKFPVGTKHLFNERKILTFDSIQFRKNNPFAPIFQQITFGVDTSGQLKIYDKSGKLIYNFCYQNKGLSKGFSLERTGIQGNCYDTNYWSNRCVGGSPGLPESVPCAPALSSNIQFSEQMLYPDSISQTPHWCEFYLPGNNKIPLKGWGILNHKNDVMWRFDDHDTLASGQVYIITQDRKSFQKLYPGYSGPLYSLNNWNGTDSLYIKDYHGQTAASCGQIPHIYALRFSENTGRSLELPYLTPGCVNGSPGQIQSRCDDKIVISEIMYSSAPGGKWFEIQNISTDTIPLNKYKFTSYRTGLNQFSNDTLFPGKIWVISDDTAAFYKWYGRHENVRSGNISLNDSFGTIIIYNEQNIPVQSVIFERYGNWPYQLEYSIESKYDTGTFCGADAWQNRCRYGSPGFDRNTPCTNTGISMQENKSTINIYPNPTSQMIYIQGINSNEKVIVTDALGKCIRIYENLNGSLDMSSFKPGIYILQIIGQNFRVVKM